MDRQKLLWEDFLTLGFLTLFSLIVDYFLEPWEGPLEAGLLDALKHLATNPSFPHDSHIQHAHAPQREWLDSSCQGDPLMSKSGNFC